MTTKIIQPVFIFVAFLATACNDTPKNITNQKQNDSLTTTSDSLKTTALDKAQEPSALLVDLADYIDSIGYTFDTIRIKKVRYFDDKDCLIYSNRIFYKLNPNNTLVFTTKKSVLPLSNVDISSINYELFTKVKSVFGYYYCSKDRISDYIEDGVIEEWNFSTEKEAEEAGIEINRIKFGVYFHTAAYIARQDNRIFIFHNRAAFEHIYKQTLKHFEKQFDVVYPFDGYTK
jgi:hypothetical protein